jgi:ketosteroid isomerase-like protein
MSQANVELIRSFYQEMGKPGQPAVLMLAPEIEWHSRSDLPDSGVHRGREGVAAFAQEWLNSFEEHHVDVGDIIGRGEYVVVPLVLRGRIRGSGAEVTMSETHVFKVRDAMIVEVREYQTPDEALAAVGLG